LSDSLIVWKVPARLRVCAAMSRAAAMQSNKKEQKAAIADKNAEKERLAALGMTPAMKRQVGDDVVMCMECGMTKLGPITVCECKGGKKRPGPSDEPIPHLIVAAQARHAAGKAEDMKANAQGQGQVAKERSKHRDAREAEQNDLNAQLIGDGGVEMNQNVEFPVGKLGMDIEANSICKIGDAPSNAADLGVKVGWVIGTVNDIAVGQKKAAIVKAVATAMKAGGAVKFGFRVPITEGFLFCGSCDKFRDATEFEEDQVAAGPGKQMCAGCAECADFDF